MRPAVDTTADPDLRSGGPSLPAIDRAASDRLSRRRPWLPMHVRRRTPPVRRERSRAALSGRWSCCRLTSASSCRVRVGSTSGKSRAWRSHVHAASSFNGRCRPTTRNRTASRRARSLKLRTVRRPHLGLSSLGGSLVDYSRQKRTKTKTIINKSRV